MARVVSNQVSISSQQIRAGRQVLDIITSGMYNHPLMVLREYVQNSADAIDEAIRLRQLTLNDGIINITVDGSNRSITVFDNGIGIRNQEAIETLCNIGCSRKDRSYLRGFRGIGRLGGIGYCRRLVFETRNNKKEKVTVISWNSEDIRNELSNTKNFNENMLDIIRRNVSVEFRESLGDEPAHFFCVRMEKIERFHRDLLMNIPIIRNYLSQVAPVPFNYEQFPFGVEINQKMAKIPGYRQYCIYLNGDQILRPHAQDVQISEKTSDTITGVTFFQVPGRDGNLVGAGWFAKMNYLASLPPRQSMRGIRVRQGNIEVGNEYFLTSHFTERRFAAWHIGEIHLSFELKTNARRDGFEETPNYEAFLEHACLLGYHLSELCRESSKLRSAEITAIRLIEEFNNLVHQTPFVIDESHRAATHDKATLILTQLESLSKLNGALKSCNKEKIKTLRTELDRLANGTPLLQTLIDGRILRRFNVRTIIVDIAQRLIECHTENPSATQELIMKAVGPYLNRRSLD